MVVYSGLSYVHIMTKKKSEAMNILWQVINIIVLIYELK